MKDNRAARAVRSPAESQRKSRRTRGLSLLGNKQLQEQRLRATLGKAARQARIRSGLTQADVAESIGTVTEVYGRMERGKLLPSVPTLLRLCVALQSGPHELMGFVPVASGENKSPWDALKPAPGQPETPELQRLVRRLGRLHRSDLRLVLLLVTSLVTRRLKR
jgi:transcriptional regulator with XRE-family HTH domain